MKNTSLIILSIGFLGACEGYNLTGHIPEVDDRQRIESQAEQGLAGDRISTCTRKEQNEGICVD